MSDQILMEVTPGTYAKETCDICWKVFAKSFINEHKKDQHSVIVLYKKKEECLEKKEEDQRKKEEEALKYKDIVEKDKIWSKIWTSKKAPNICNVM